MFIRRKRNHPIPCRVLARFLDGCRPSVAETNLGPRWLLMDSAKMSKSLGNVVRPRPIVHVSAWTLSHYLLRETVFGQDGNFSYDNLVVRYNSDLRMDR